MIAILKRFRGVGLLLVPLLVGQQASDRDQFNEKLEQTDPRDGRAMLDAICAGMGIGMTSPRAMANFPELQRVLPGYVGTSFPVFAVYPASGQRSARLQAVVAALEAVMQ